MIIGEHTGKTVQDAKPLIKVNFSNIPISLMNAHFLSTADLSSHNFLFKTRIKSLMSGIAIRD